MSKILTIIILFIISTNLLAIQSIRLEQLSLEHGLSQGEVNSLIQDSDGYLWLGTQQGLNIYDGHRIRTISGPDNLLEIQSINMLFADSKKNIWVGSVPNRNFKISKSDNTITEINPPFPEGREIQDSAFFAISEDEQSNLWLATMRAIFHYDSTTEKLTFVVDFEPTLDQRDIIRKLYSLDKTLMVATSEGLFTVDKTTHKIQRIPFENQLSLFDANTASDRQDDRINVKGIYRNAENNILLATVEGLYEMNSQSLGSFLSGAADSVNIKVLEPELNIWRLIEEANFYWLATHQGLVKLNKNGEKHYVFAYSDTIFQSADNNILDMIKDNEGNLWMGSRNDGAFKWNPNTDHFTYYQQSGTGSRTLTNNRVWASNEDNQGNVWIGTRNGLNRIDRVTGEVRQFIVNNDIKATSSKSTVVDIEVQGEDIWLATVGGVRKFNAATMQETQLELNAEQQEVLGKTPRDLFFLDKDTMGIIHQEGLYTYNTKTGDVSFNENTDSKGKITRQLSRMVATDPKDSDKLYITMVDQVVRYSKSSGSYQPMHALPPSDKPRTYAADVYINDKHTWIAYPGFGLYIIDNLSGKEIKHITSLDGMPDNSPLEIKPDKKGNIWVTSNSGLIRFDKDTFHFRVYDTNDGLSTNEFNGGASLVTQSGEFYLGSIKGVMKVDPAKLVSSDHQRMMQNHITEISLMSRQLPESFSPIVDFQLNLSHADYGLKIKFSALSLSNPKKLTYKYWIEGSSKTKPSFTKESELFLPKLEAGNSIFKVSVIDYETGKESLPQSLYLNVSPHPAFSIWAFALYAIFLFTIAFSFYWQRRKRQIALLKAHTILQTNEERLQLALTGSDSGLWDWQSENNSVFEPRLQQFGNLDSEHIEFERRLEFIHVNEQARYQRLWNEFIAGSIKVFEFVYRMKTVSGEWAWYRDLARVTQTDKSGHPCRVTGTYIDITKSKDDDDKVLLFSEAFQSTRDIIVICDNNSIVQAANSALYRATAYTEEQVLEHPVKFLVSENGESIVNKSAIQQLSETGQMEAEGYLERLYRHPLPVLISANSFTNALEQTRFVFAITDIEEQKNAQEELRKLANYDSLTGLPNRALLMDRINHALAIANRKSHQIALFFIDLDRFKQINDSLGHDIGDLLLQTAAEVLKQSTRKNDTVARLGGDEFVVMLEDVQQVDVMSRIAQTILDNMAQPVQLLNHEVSISSSIGIAIFPDDGTSSDELMKHADIAMYHAKNSGRNNFQFFTEKMNAAAHNRMKLENELRAAIRNNEFILHYQPKISLEDNHIHGFELLARWKRADGSLVPPFEFIPLSEELGLIISITEQLIDQAMQTMQHWMQLGINTSFALNLSARHLHHHELIPFVEEKLEQYQVPASAFEFELTESTIMEDMNSAVKLLGKLNQMGVAISLDDFGTGYTSFKYLKDFPIDALKIDRSFVKDIGVDLKDEAIIEAIITLSSKLGISTIAEGVETIEQAEYLKNKGCPLVQGFLYSKPVAVEQALVLIQNKSINP